MRRFYFLAPAVAFILLAGCLLCSGCVAHGHRKVTIDIFGQHIVIEDEVFADESGEQNFVSGFDENSSMVKLFFGWLFPAADDAGGEETAKPEEADEVLPPGG